jgi:TolA-binding protein
MNNIVPADEDCLSQDQLSRYVQDECRLEEMRWIDRHLLNCPMCSDAVEGAMLSDVTDFQSVMSRVEAKIDTKVQTNWVTQVETPPLTIVKPNRFLIGQRPLKWAAAAGLMGVMTLGVWQYSAQNVLKSAPKMEAVAATPAPVAPVTTEIVAAPAAVMPQTDAAMPAAKTLPAPKAATSNVYAETPLVANKPMSSKTQASTSVSPSADLAELSPNKNKKEDSNTDNHSKQPVSDQTNDVKLSETRAEATAEAERTKDATTSKLPAPPPAPVAAAPSAPSVYQENGGYGGAGNQVHGAAAPAKKTKSRSNTTDLYDNAYNAYKQKSYTAAITGFNQVLAQQPSDKNEIYENTLWYLADAYLQAGDKVKAKALLERIVAEKLQNQRKASQKLKELN